MPLFPIYSSVTDAFQAPCLVVSACDVFRVMHEARDALVHHSWLGTWGIAVREKLCKYWSQEKVFIAFMSLP